MRTTNHGEALTLHNNTAVWITLLTTAIALGAVLALVDPSPGLAQLDWGILAAAGRRAPAVRVVIYVRGTDEQVEEQLRQCRELCLRRGYDVKAIARDLPGATTAWDSAGRMRRGGEIDRVIVASASIVPEVLESATGALPGPREWRRAGVEQRRRVRRTRPTRRGDDGGA